MKKFWLQIALILIVIFGALVLVQNPALFNALLPGTHSNKTQEIKINQITLKVELADTAQLRQKGLSGREALATDSGMLFVFSETKKYQFWMKQMKFALDLIFIRDGQIVDITENAVPPLPNQADSELTIYQPNTQINGLLEVNAGFARANQIKIGDLIISPTGT